MLMAASGQSPSVRSPDDAPLWQFVPLPDFEVPSKPVLQSARGRLDALYELVRLRPRVQEKPVKTEDELGHISEAELQRLVPEPDWKEAASALDGLLCSRDRERSSATMTLVVGPPYGGMREILNAFASLRSVPVVEPPSRFGVLEKDETWLHQLRKQKPRWVFPALEATFVRHPAGLWLARQLLGEARNGSFGHVVIGCDSWSWELISRFTRGLVGHVHVLQAFGPEEFSVLFRRLAESGRRRRPRFRQSDNGNDILPSPEGEEGGSEKSGYLQQLAGRSRGNIGIARVLWKTGMQVEPEEGSQQDDEKGSALHRTIWVRPLDKLSLPSVPSSAEIDVTLVLHGLLVHNGISTELLAEALPLSLQKVAGLLYWLGDEGLAVDEGGRWRVSPLGYPAVRSHLQTRGFLVDQC